MTCVHVCKIYMCTVPVVFPKVCFHALYRKSRFQVSRSCAHWIQLDKLCFICFLVLLKLNQFAMIHLTKRNLRLRYYYKRNHCIHKVQLLNEHLSVTQARNAHGESL